MKLRLLRGYGGYARNSNDVELNTEKSVILNKSDTRSLNSNTRRILGKYVPFLLIVNVL